MNSTTSIPWKSDFRVNILPVNLYITIFNVKKYDTAGAQPPPTNSLKYKNTGM